MGAEIKATPTAAAEGTLSMEQLLKEQERLEGSANLDKAVEDIQKLVDGLKAAKHSVQADPSSAPLTYAKLQRSAKESFDRANENLKEIYSGLNKYSKALEKKFKESPLPLPDDDTLASQVPLVNRAIAMHLLREGHFEVAGTFISEANADCDLPSPIKEDFVRDHFSPASNHNLASEAASKLNDPFESGLAKHSGLQSQFHEMYEILRELRHKGNLQPAIAWARQHSAVLEARGSNLEYDLCRLQYIALFTSTAPGEGPLAAVQYARETFPSFPGRYSKQTNCLSGALAFTSNLQSSPYAGQFSASSDSNTTQSAAAAFTSEFCALLSLSSASPLLTAVTAGSIALPRLQKLSQIQRAIHTSWTTASELPVEIPLPPGYQFHSVFVCPVSKEQSTDTNPPMMMLCGHVIARESMDRLSRGARFKCPYCPAESHPKDALQIYL